MIRTILLALALAAGVSSAAQAQEAQAIPTCGSASLSLGPGNNIFVDQTGNLCTSSAGGSGQAIAPSSTAGSAITPTVSRGATVMTAKAAPGNLYGFSFTQGATAGLFAIIDAAAAPTAGAAITPVECIAVPASGYVARRQDIADRYVNGIQVVSTTSCTTYTANTPVQMAVSVQ